jgi:hypothetical protein
MELTTRPMADLAAADSAPSIAELAALHGDLSKLNSDQRMQYYGEVCRSVGLNPLTRPFSFINLNGKLTLYASKDATDQLRRIYNISIDKPEIDYVGEEWVIVTVVARDPHGRTDSDVGVVGRKDMKGDFGNVLMKAITKAKRRVTLSICGLGMLDESELHAIPDAQPVHIDYDTGEIIQQARPQSKAAPSADRLRTALQELLNVAAKVGITFDEYDITVMDAQQLTDLGKAVRTTLVARIEDMAEDAIDYDLPEGWQQFKAVQLDALVTDLIAAIAHANEIVEGEVVQSEAL